MYDMYVHCKYHTCTVCTNGDHDERDSANVPHVAVELEVAFPAQDLVPPLHNPAATHTDRILNIMCTQLHTLHKIASCTDLCIYIHAYFAVHK